LIEPFLIAAYLEGVGGKPSHPIWEWSSRRRDRRPAMKLNSALRGVLGVLVALALSSGAPTLAAAPASTSHASMASSQTIQPAATCTPGARACPIRITFASGAYSGQAHSTLTGIHSERWFVVNAHAEQTMIVIVKGAGATRGIVYFPDGTSRGQPGGRVFDEIVPATGDYRIRVTESPMGEGWSGGVDVVVVIY
jgi:hypothetical protein